MAPKCKAKDPFDYDDIEYDQPPFEFLQAGLRIYAMQMSEIRQFIRDKMDERGMMTGDKLNTNNFNDLITGLISTLVKDAVVEIKKYWEAQGIPQPWVERFCKTLIHMERRNSVRTKPLKALNEDSNKRPVSRESDSDLSSRASKSSHSSSKRKSEETESTDEDEPRKSKSLKLDPSLGSGLFLVEQIEPWNRGLCRLTNL